MHQVRTPTLPGISHSHVGHLVALARTFEPSQGRTLLLLNVWQKPTDPWLNWTF